MNVTNENGRSVRGYGEGATHCFAVPGAHSIIDVVDPISGKSWINGYTLEETRARGPEYENAELMELEEFCRAKAARQNTPIVWSECTEEHYWDMLEVLPPAAMGRGGFLVGEPSDHCAATGKPRYAAYAARYGKFYVASRPMTVTEFKEHLSGVIEVDSSASIASSPS